MALFDGAPSIPDPDIIALSKKKQNLPPFTNIPHIPVAPGTLAAAVFAPAAPLEPSASVTATNAILEATMAAPAAKPAEPGFETFGLKPTLMRGVQEAGFTAPSPIQQQVIPLILGGRDVVGQAHTGTGKTAAFGLPGMNMIEHTGNVEMLVITPTRELATQVSDEIYRLGRFEQVSTIAIYGGQPYGHQLDSLRRGVQVVVATPGRLLDLLEGGRVGKFIKPSLVVLDEADEMLDMGFLEDIKKIFTHLPEERQTLLFSATMPKPIRDLASTILKNPAFISVNPKEATVREIQQHYYVIGEHERDDAIVRLLECLEAKKSIIFCRLKSEVDRLSTTLLGRGFFARGLHGDMEQSQREEVVAGFRSGAANILVATDVAARGLDVADVTHVFNYHIPFDPDSYVHRIGRTGRAGKKGMAVTLITPQEYQGLKRIQGMVGRIQLSFIPTRKEMRKAVAERIIETVRQQTSTRESEKVFEMLVGEMDLADIACRLLALQLERESISGPDNIGYDSAAVERMQRPGPPTSRYAPPRRGAPPRGGNQKYTPWQKPGGFKKAGRKP